MKCGAWHLWWQSLMTTQMITCYRRQPRWQPKGQHIRQSRWQQRWLCKMATQMTAQVPTSQVKTQMTTYTTTKGQHQLTTPDIVMWVVIWVTIYVVIWVVIRVGIWRRNLVCNLTLACRLSSGLSSCDVICNEWSGSGRILSGLSYGFTTGRVIWDDTFPVLFSYWTTLFKSSRCFS
jgi:hypothetical protein